MRNTAAKKERKTKTTIHLRPHRFTVSSTLTDVED